MSIFGDGVIEITHIRFETDTENDEVPKRPPRSVINHLGALRF